MIFEVAGAQILCMLLVPIFTLEYKGGFLGKRDDKMIELKIKKRTKL